MKTLGAVQNDLSESDLPKANLKEANLSRRILVNGPYAMGTSKRELGKSEL